jgi:ParB-like chromosome segregation protein Spo0J
LILSRYIVSNWAADEVRSLLLEEIDVRYGRYRLSVLEADEAMTRSLRRYGQIAPVVVCLREEVPVLVDGFKRVRSARGLVGFSRLLARRIEVDEQGAKAAMYRLNGIGRHFGELEEAWLVQALVREDGLSQIEVAALLGRHKSWVCRRLAMMEKLAPAAQEDLQLGLLSPTMARQLTRLPAGNQEEALATARTHSLTAAELRGVVELLLASGTREKTAFVLERPREALREAQAGEVRGWDPRLSVAGNRVGRHLAALLDQLARMTNWLRHRGRGDLALCDRGVLEPSFVRLAGEAHTVAELSEDFVKEIHLP